MTNDEFERIGVALVNCRGINLNGQYHIPLNAVLRILHSNLAREDRDAWVWNEQAGTWTRNGITQ